MSDTTGNGTGPEADPVETQPARANAIGRLYTAANRLALWAERLDDGDLAARIAHEAEIVAQAAVGGCLTELSRRHVCNRADGHPGPHITADGITWQGDEAPLLALLEASIAKAEAR